MMITRSDKRQLTRKFFLSVLNEPSACPKQENDEIQIVFLKPKQHEDDLEVKMIDEI